MQFVVFEKFMSAYLFQIAQEKSCDYVLITFMKKYEIAYHRSKERACIKWKNNLLKFVRSVYDQNNNIQ